MSAKILLVDDVNMFLELMKGFLKLSAAKILTARDGVEALGIAKKETPSLIFMDLNMPLMDGADCCAKLKGDPELRNIPVVMITAAGNASDKARCIVAGADAFLTKPLDRQLFLEKARDLLPIIDRRNKRVKYRAKVRFKLYGVTLSGEIMDVGEHGIYIATDYKVKQGGELDVVFTLPDGAASSIQTKGRIAWCNSGENRPKPALPEGFGVEFTAISEESQRALDLFVAKG